MTRRNPEGLWEGIREGILVLILTRKLGESVIIGDHVVRITVVEIKGKQVKLAIDAPREVIVYREEAEEKIRQREQTRGGQDQ